MSYELGKWYEAKRQVRARFERVQLNPDEVAREMELVVAGILAER